MAPIRVVIMVSINVPKNMQFKKHFCFEFNFSVMNSILEYFVVFIVIKKLNKINLKFKTFT